VSPCATTATATTTAKAYRRVRYSPSALALNCGSARHASRLLLPLVRDSLLTVLGARTRYAHRQTPSGITSLGLPFDCSRCCTSSANYTSRQFRQIKISPIRLSTSLRRAGLCVARGHRPTRPRNGSSTVISSVPHGRRRWRASLEPTDDRYDKSLTLI